MVNAVIEMLLHLYETSSVGKGPDVASLVKVNELNIRTEFPIETALFVALGVHIEPSPTKLRGISGNLGSATAPPAIYAGTPMALPCTNRKRNRSHDMATGTSVTPRGRFRPMRDATPTDGSGQNKTAGPDWGRAVSSPWYHPISPPSTRAGGLCPHRVER